MISCYAVLQPTTSYRDTEFGHKIIISVRLLLLSPEFNFWEEFVD